MWLHVVVPIRPTSMIVVVVVVIVSADIVVVHVKDFRRKNKN